MFLKKTASKKDEKKRFELNFYGRVQGVGFRYTACHAANSLGLTGWVKNEYDGSVSMQVQGSLQTINKLVSVLEKGTFIQIDNIQKKELSLLENESSFQINDY